MEYFSVHEYAKTKDHFPRGENLTGRNAVFPLYIFLLHLQSLPGARYRSGDKRMNPFLHYYFTPGIAGI